MSQKRSTRSNPALVPSTSTMTRERSLLVSTLNPQITCPLCMGYFVEATTVIDCLHTFCRSCLLKHFEDNNDCPKCNYMIHQSHPSQYVSFDRTMQDIVYKLVPGMQAEEQKRKEQFKQKNKNRENGPTDTLMTEDKNDNATCLNGEECCSNEQDMCTAHHRKDETVLIQLIPGPKLKEIERPYVRISTYATITTVKRLIAYLLYRDLTKYNEYDLFCNEELMGRDYSLAFIQKTRWRNKPEPIVLIYREHLDF